jgi:hypothetical protein
MTTRPLTRLLGLISAAAFAAFPLVRPWGDKSGDPQAMVDAFASPRWLIAHSMGMIAWVLLTATLVSLAGTDRWSRASAWMAGLGTAAVLPYYGSETFGLHGLATAARTADIGLVATAQETIRTGALAATCFALGLLLLAAAGVAVATSTWRSSSSHRWLAIPFGLGLVTYLPQFFTPNIVRQAHGLALALAIALWLQLRDESPETPTTAQSADQRSAEPMGPGERAL